MSNLLLPGDPDFDKPITWGDPFAQGLTPKSAAEKHVKEAEAAREKEPNNFKYASSMVAHAPDPGAKFAQAVGGINNIMTQPMFFSPLHTNIQWQIASKRREIYNWQVNENTEIVTEDYTFKTIRDLLFRPTSIIKDTRTDGILYESIHSEFIMGGSGEMRRPVRFSIRECIEKKSFEFQVNNLWRSCCVSEEHPLLVLRKHDDKKYIEKIEAQKINIDDYLLTPVPPVGNKTLNADKSRLIGSLLSNGNKYPVLDRTNNELDTYIVGTRHFDKLSSEIFSLDRESRLHFLGGYIDANGGRDENGNVQIDCASKDISDQVYWILLSVGICPSIEKHKLESTYIVCISQHDINIIQPYLYENLQNIQCSGYILKHRPFFVEYAGVKYLAQSIKSIRQFKYSGKGYDLQIDPERTFVADGIVSSNCRFFFDGEPKVAAAINFYAHFSMNGFKLECKHRKVLKFFEHHVVKKLALTEIVKQISTEYFVLGDVFVHSNIHCKTCLGSAVDPETGEMCNHPGGMIDRLVVLNPDWIEVQQSQLADEPSIALIPDEELKRIVFLRQPKQIYDRLPPLIKKLVLENKPIPLSNRTVSHLKHMPSPYATYGTSLIRRLFTTLAYKTKLMSANWIVAERLILPIRIVKVGSDERPAATADIADVQQQLAAVANNPNLTIVSHHNIEIDWVGASGKILQVTQELEHIDKEILDGFMLNQSLLNGEMCLPDDHLVKTQDGYKWMNSVTREDAIQVWDSTTDTYHFEKPKDFYVYDNVPYIYEIWSQDAVLFKCTENHKIVLVKINDKGEKTYQKVTPRYFVENYIDEEFTLLYGGAIVKISRVEKIPYGRSVYCFETSTGYFVAKYKDNEFISGNSGYSSAQVGVETLIRRIEAWRTTLAHWIEDRVFKPIAEMQGFVDEEESEDLGERCYIYPTIKWNDLNLKDKTQWYQLLMQLHDKQVISTQTLMEEMNLNYDQEVKRKRYEMVNMGPAGGMLGMGAPPGGGMGLGGMPGGPGGAPGGLDGGMGGMPGAPGGTPGAPGGMDMMGGGGAGLAGGMGGAPGGPTASGTGKIMKKGKGEKQKQNQEHVQMPSVALTKLEQEMANMLIDVLTTLNMSPQQVRAQYPVQNPKGGKPFMIDFAVPMIKLGIESDGEAYHSLPEQQMDDQERDGLLAQRGWTVLRFNDKSIQDAPHAVKQTIATYIQKLIDKYHNQKHQKQASLDEFSDICLFTCEKGKLTRLVGDDVYLVYFEDIKNRSDNTAEVY